MKLTLILLFIFPYYWCFGPNISEDEKSKSTLIKSASSDELKKIGSAILRTEDFVGINELIIYQFIDSIRVKDSAQRSFYFRVFNVIRNKFKGATIEITAAVAEYVSLKARDYCRNYPDEFFCMSDSILKSYAYDIGEEIRTEEEDANQYTKDYISEIKKKCDPKYILKVDQFSKYIFEEMESRK